MPRSRPYLPGLKERLKDPDYAAAYLNAAKEQSQEVFLLALRDVAEASKIGKVAAAARVNRESLYRALSAKGNPTLATFNSVLAVLGVEMEFRPRESRRKQLRNRSSR